MPTDKRGSDDSRTRIRTVGHRRYDSLLRTVMASVRNNASREDLLDLCITELDRISMASAVFVIESEAVGSIASLSGYLCKGVNEKRWRTFCSDHIGQLSESSVLWLAVEGDEEIALWNGRHFTDEFAGLESLLDGVSSGWMSAIKLRRATAQHPNRALVLWYEGRDESYSTPVNAEQDWRFLSFFQLCYELAAFSIRRAARDIAAHRAELVSTLAPSVLTHEVAHNIHRFTTTLGWCVDDIKHLEGLFQEDTGTVGSGITRLSHNICDILQPSAMSLADISETIMRLTSRKRGDAQLCNAFDELRAAKRFVDLKANQAGVRLNVRCRTEEERSIQITTDPSLLMHAILNLLINAISAVESHADQDASSRVVDLSLENYRATFDGIKILVADNGPGVPESIQQSIFEPGVTTKRDGHGLGLPICGTIARYLGGEVVLESARNPTVFALHLPLQAREIADLSIERSGR